MTLYAREIDDDTFSNKAYKERWQEKYGSILNKLKECICVNCEKLLKDQDKVMYVACHSGAIKVWHLKCKVKYGKT